ncbi:uncharacterized protein L203_104671 [Cryptococcus depauperatus CBS 7841]|uniref:BZIP domain-containing protein n=1 Tax=Cryptococcus depauperatus CBS 7841 TaxID=1295531 RepID=A0AAJ8JVX1_9TREE
MMWHSDSMNVDPNMAPHDNHEMAVGASDFEELFNFDGFASSGLTSTHDNSPSTVSSHPTPSSLPLREPHLISPSALDLDLEDIPIGLTLDKPKSQERLSVSASDNIANGLVKQEPFDYASFPIPDILPEPTPMINPVAAAPSPFAGLPVDQQVALQQLMENIMNYQKTFGPGLPESHQAGKVNVQTIEPSMLFAASPLADGEVEKSAVSVASESTFAPASANIPVPELVTNKPIVDPTSSTSDHIPHAFAFTNTLARVDEDEPLCSVSSSSAVGNAESSRTRATSTAPFEDFGSRIDRLVSLPEIFSAGKGKGGKKGGGLSSVVREEGEEIDEDDSWRPSPEEYKKLSSKEKRQLRNKLSARAFRTRRKDYIGTLEAHIKDSYVVIDEMRSELINSQNENQDLRRELEALKASTMSVLHPESAQNSISPAMVTALANSPAFSASAASHSSSNSSAMNVKRPHTPLNMYNPRKDLPNSLKGSWVNDNMFGGGGSTICHTMFTPDLVLPSASSSMSTMSGLKSFHELPRQNLNPLLNSSSEPVLPHTLSNPANGREISSSFSEWTESTPFSLRSMDAYRMQMWSRLAREVAANKGGMSGDLKPKFFVEGSGTGAEAVGSLAVEHITSKLTSSFLSAFSSSSGIDTDKLTAVVTGQAKLKVVAHDEKDEDQALAQLMSGLKMQIGSVAISKRRCGEGARENPLGVFCGWLKHAGGMPTRA